MSRGQHVHEGPMLLERVAKARGLPGKTEELPLALQELIGPKVFRELF